MRILLLLVTGFVLGEVCSLCSSIIIELVILLLFAGVVFFLWRDRNNRTKRWLLLLPFFLLGGVWYYGFFTEEGDTEKELLKEQSGKLEGTVSSVVGKASGNVVYLRRCTFENTVCLMELPGEVAVYSLKDTEQLKLGNQICLTGTLMKILPPSNFGQFDSVVYYNSRGIYYQYRSSSWKLLDPGYWRYRNGLRRIRDTMEQVYVHYLGERDAGMVSAMVLGQKTYLEEERKALYQENGIAHIMAISGLHVGLLGMMAYRWLKKCLLPAPVCAAVSIWLLVSYGTLTGMGGAAMRAIIMLIVVIIGDVIGRTGDTLTSMGLAGFVMLLMNPVQIFDAGFLLSYGAIAGIGGIGPILEKIIPGEGRLVQGFRSGLAVQLATTPILLYFYYEIAPYSLLLNLLVIPLMSVLLPCAIGVGTLGYYVEFAGKLLGLPVIWILKLYDRLCGLCSMLPGSRLVSGRPGIASVLLYYLVLALVLYLLQQKKWKQVLLILWIAVAAFFLTSGEAPGISILDVGQGDCIYLYTGERRYLIDGGSSSVGKAGQYRIEPFLKAKGVGYLDGVILTHMDGDHISGVEELLEREYPVGSLILGDIEDKTQYASMTALAEENGTRVQYMASGDEIRDGNSCIRCLHPASGYRGEDTNANSIVLNISMEGCHMLFTGDLGQEQEEELLSDVHIKRELEEQTPCDLLKVGHHGSKNSTGEKFLEVLKPRAAVISCGEDNSYGHPHQETIDRLQKAGSDVYITMESGEIDISFSGEELIIQGFLETFPD